AVAPAARLGHRHARARGEGGEPMSALTPQERRRLDELIADDQLDQLSLEEADELARLRDRSGEGEGYDTPVAAMLTRLCGDDTLPEDLRQRLIARLQGMTAPAMRIAPTPIIRRLAWPLLAATILLAAGASFLALRSSRDKAALATANTHHAEVLAQAAE